MNKIDALKHTALFGELDPATLSLLAARAVERTFRKGDVLFVAGEEALGLFVIVTGSVRAFRESTDGREQVIHIERAGATVGRSAGFR